MHSTLEDVCRRTALELDRIETTKVSPPSSPRMRRTYLDKTFAVKLTRIREKRAANIIIGWWRSIVHRRKPTINLMLRAIQNNKTIKDEIKSLRVELEIARKRKEVEYQAAILKETFSPAVSPYRACRLLVNEPLTSPPAIEQLLSLLNTDASSIRATQLNAARTEISFILCLTRCKPVEWSKILANLPPTVIKDISFPEVLSKDAWAEEFEEANSLPPIWTIQKWKFDDGTAAPVTLSPAKFIERMNEKESAKLIDENGEAPLSPTVKQFVESLKDRVKQSRAVDQETMDAFGALGNRRRRRRSGEGNSD